jgi:hypothetical protein
MECAGIEGDEPIVRGVKLLGEESKNRRRYLPESVQAAEYEGKPVNLNHTTEANQQRDVKDRFGWIGEAVKDGDKWRGNIHYNPAHPFAAQFAWIAKNKPELIGLSHDAVGQGHTKDGVFVVEKVLSVKSVDLVADPATTKGLFESMDPTLDTTPTDTPGDEIKSFADHLADAIKALVTDEGMDAKEKLKKMKGAMKLLDDPGADDEEDVEEDDEEDKKTEESVKAVFKTDKKLWGAGIKRIRESIKVKAKKKPSKTKSLMERLDAAEAKLAAKDRSDLAAKLIAEAKLPAVAVTKTFLAQLSEAKDESAMKALVEDRKQLSSIQIPRSFGAGAGNGGGKSEITTKTFAAKLKEGR